MLSEIVSDNSNTENNILTNDIVPCKFEFENDEVKVRGVRNNMISCEQKKKKITQPPPHIPNNFNVIR